DVDAMEKMITDKTILLVGSAPAYPHGVIDPIADIAALAKEHGLLCHVDACVGGFMLPFARKLGREIPAFDFSVPGVTAMSAAIRDMPELRVIGDPAMSVFAFTSDVIDVYALGDAMQERGWHLDRQQRPPSLHMMITPAHEKLVPEIVSDMRACAMSVKRGAAP